MTNEHNDADNKDDEEQGCSWGPCTIIDCFLPPICYIIDAGFDIYFTWELWTLCHYWWFTISSVSIIIPELGIGIYIARRLYVINLKHSMLCITTLGTPLLLLPYIRLLALSWKAFLKFKSRDEQLAMKIIHKMTKIKAWEAILQSVPQLYLKSYMVLHTIYRHQLMEIHSTDVPLIEINSTDVPLMEINTTYEPVMNITSTNISLCGDIEDFHDNKIEVVGFLGALWTLASLSYSLAGLEYQMKRDEKDWWRKTIFFVVFFITIGARITVIGVIGSWYAGSWHAVIWFAPPGVACFIAFLGVLIHRKMDKSRKEPVLKFDLDLFSHILLSGLLLAIPTVDGILVCLSYIGWAVWFYMETDVQLRSEALSLSIVMQIISLLFVYYLGSINYNVFFFGSSKSIISNEESKDNETKELQEKDSNMQ